MTYLHQSLAQRCHFQTGRLTVTHWRSDTAALCLDELSLAQPVMTILTPVVTKALPPSWQQIDNEAKALAWLAERDAESVVLTLQLGSGNRSAEQIIGFLLLHADVCSSDTQNSDEALVNLRIGYLLAESVWGQGLANELLSGLLDWCKADGGVHAVSGGVDVDNKASIRVLEKNGFKPIEEGDMPSGVLFFTRVVRDSE